MTRFEREDRSSGDYKSRIGEKTGTAKVGANAHNFDDASSRNKRREVLQDAIEVEGALLIDSSETPALSMNEALKSINMRRFVAFDSLHRLDDRTGLERIEACSRKIVAAKLLDSLAF